MRHQFTHTFQDGRTLTVVVDMSVNPPRFAAYPKGLANEHPTEFEAWVERVIVPGLIDLATPAQLVTFATKGMEVLS